jgi:diphosphomevalonate decarboxylase
LSGLETRTTVTLDSARADDQVVLNGKSDLKTQRRVTRCLDMLREHVGLSAGALVVSSNSFPTGAGLASSASGYAALIKAAATALEIDADPGFLDLVARVGSGSAPRSLYDGIVLLRNSSDGGVSCESISAPESWPLTVIVAVTSTLAKDVGSTEGMELSRKTSPFYQAWLDSHPADLDAAVEAVHAQDFNLLAALSEHNCLKMHAVAMTSRDPLFYWSPATVACLQRVWELRHSGLPVFFTIDAGPQLKAVCSPEASADVQAALAEVPGVLETIECGLGRGAWAES